MKKKNHKKNIKNGKTKIAWPRLALLKNQHNNPSAGRLHDEKNRQYSLATLARSKGLDPSAKVESQTTYDLAERVEKAVGPVGIAERIRELVKIISREETALDRKSVV